MIPKLVMGSFRKNRKLSLSLNSWFTVPFRFRCEFYSIATQVLVVDGYLRSCNTARILPDTYWVIHCYIHKRTSTSPVISLENEKTPTPLKIIIKNSGIQSPIRKITRRTLLY